MLACDTEVIVDGEVFGKPPTAEAAHAMLTRLAGQTHEVLGGIVVRRGDDEWEAVASTTVRFRALESAELDEYVQTGEWEGRAGGYAIQGRGAALVDGIEGDFWNVVGLPVPELVRLLKNAC